MVKERPKELFFIIMLIFMASIVFITKLYYEKENKDMKKA